MAQKPLDAPTDLQIHLKQLADVLGKMPPERVIQTWPILAKVAEDIRQVNDTWAGLVKLVGNMKTKIDEQDRLVSNIMRSLGCILKKHGGTIIVEKALFDGYKKGTEIAADHDAEGNLVVRMREPEEKKPEETRADG